MALKLSDLHKNKPLATIDTSIGELCLFSITVRDQLDLLKSLGVPIKDAGSGEYFKKILIYTLYPVNELKNGKYKPDSPILTLEKIDELSDQELEDIAEAYILNSEYLYKKREFQKKKDSDGKDVHYSVYTETEHPRQDGESHVDYLCRLSSIELDNQQEKMKGVLDSIPKLDSFSKALSGGIAKNLLLGDSIANSIKSARSAQEYELPPSFPPIEPIDWAEINRNNERVRREPFNELAKRLDELINSSIQASDFMVEANRIQTEIAAEIKAGGDTTDRHARNNIKLSCIVLSLTLIGLMVSGWSIVSGVSFSNEQQRAFDGYTSRLSESLIISTRAVEDSSSEAQEGLGAILFELKSLNGNLIGNQKSLTELYRETSSLKNSNKEYKRKIEELNREIEKLKNNEYSNQKP